MSADSSFFRLDSDEDGIDSTIDIVLEALRNRSQDMSNTDDTEPWALIIAKDDGPLLHGISRRFYQQPEDRTWFDSIQICRIDAVNQLKARLCSLHLPVTEQRNEILDIIEYEKHGQPPAVLVVIDLIDFLVIDSSQNELQYLATSFNELSSLLACLLESCIYLSTRNGGVNMNHSTELVVTDPLPSNVDEMTNAFQQSYTVKLYQILNYYLEHVYS